MSRYLRRQVAPFVCCLFVVVVLLPMQDHLDVVEVVLALGLQVGVGLVLLAGPRIGDRRWPAAVGLVAFLTSVALLRDGVGATAGFGPLLFLPVMWTAVLRRRLELGFVIFGIALVYALPQLLIGAPSYPVSGWRSGALTVVVAGALGRAVIVLVERLHRLAHQSTAVLAAMSEGFALTRDGEIIAVNPALCALTGFSEAQLLGARPPFPFSPPELRAEAEVLRERMAAAHGGEFEATLMRADGSRFPAEISAAPTDLGDGLPAFLNTIRDITERREHADTQRRLAEQLTAIAHVARAVGHGDSHDARRTVARTALTVCGGAHAVRIWETDPDGGLITTATQPETATPQRIAAGATEHGAHVVMRTGKPLFVADAANSPHCDPSIVRQVGTVSSHFHPIGDAFGICGVLALSWPRSLTSLSDDELLIIGVLADEAAIAMRRADLLTRLDDLARHDELTGLANRRAWDELLTRELANARRHGQPLSIAMLDLDNFKRYNDDHGHLAGDRLLRHAADTWLRHLRPTDLLARWGGEEFVLLLPVCDSAGAAEIVERLRDTLPDGVTFSAGITTADPGAGPQDLVAAADQALYTAKASGRNHITVA